MNKWICILLAFFVAFAPLGMKAGMAMESAPANEISTVVITDTSQVEKSQPNCCAQHGDFVSDLHGHCGLSCATFPVAFSLAYHPGVAIRTTTFFVGLAGSPQSVPERPPRILF